MSPAIITNATLTDPLTTSIDREVSWPTILWALLPIMFNSMTQPAGSIVHGITAEQSFYLRASPIVCVIEALAVLARLIYGIIRFRNPRLAVAYVCRAKLEESSDAELARTQLQSLQENDVFRGILFVFGVLPQLLKLYACTSIPGSQTLASLYLGSWIVLELLVVTPARYGALNTSGAVSSVRAFVDIMDRLVAWTCHVVIHYSDFMALHIMRVDLDPLQQIHNPWWVRLANMAMIVLCLLLLSARVAYPRFAVFGAFIYVFWLLLLIKPGVAKSVWLIALELGRFVAVIGLPGSTFKQIIETEGQFLERITDGSSFTDYTRTGSVAFFLMQVLTAVGFYGIQYDPSGTSKPAWTEYLG